MSDGASLQERPRLLSTGMLQLDEFLGGGLEPGSTVLLVEPTGAGGEIFAKQFAAGTLSQNGNHSLYVTTDESAAEVEVALREFGFPGHPEILSIAELYASRVLQQEQTRVRGVVPQSTAGLLKTDSSDFLKKGAADRAMLPEGTDFLNLLLRGYDAPHPPHRLVVHTIDFFVGVYGVNRVVDAVTAVKAANAKAGGLFLLVLSSGSQKTPAETRLERVADCLIELEFQRRSSQFEKFLLVKKVKNKYMGVGVAPYQVTKHGIELDNLNRIL